VNNCFNRHLGFIKKTCKRQTLAYLAQNSLTLISGKVTEERKILVLHGSNTLYGHIGYTLIYKEIAVTKVIKQWAIVFIPVIFLV
jgi:hypothetical protein